MASHAKHPQPAEEELVSGFPSAEIVGNSNRQDLLRRFTPTPYATKLAIMGTTVRLESNSRAIVEMAVKFFGRYQHPSPGIPDFLWRIVGEPNSQKLVAGVELTAFSDLGLRFANIEQRGFLAVDLDAREAVGFVDEGSVESEPRLHCRSLFDTLFCLCAGSFGKVSLEAACVGRGEKGVLILGPPDSGKTTTSYLAAKSGLEYHADQAVFLEMQAGRLRAWGDLLPAIFRPETLDFLPELRASTRHFSYPSLTVHYLPKTAFQGSVAHSVDLVCCVFLKRGVGFQAALTPIAPHERRHRLLEGILYREDGDFDDQTRTIVDHLLKVPSYELAFSDPARAAVSIRDLLLDTGPGEES